MPIQITYKRKVCRSNLFYDPTFVNLHQNRLAASKWFKILPFGDAKSSAHSNE
jgi:hypothetical protein